MIKSMLSVVLASWFAASPPHDAKLELPGVAPLVLAEMQLDIDNEKRMVLLQARERLTEKPLGGREWVFELLHAKSPGRDEPRAFELALTLPDIPTHDLAGVPLPARFGAVIHDRTEPRLYVAIGKCSGGSTILRVYELGMTTDRTGGVQFSLDAGLLAQTERHFTLDSQPPKSFSIELRNKELLLVGRSARPPGQEWKLTLDLATKLFRSEAQNP